MPDFKILKEVPQREVALALWGDGDFRDVTDVKMARFARAFHFSIVNHTLTLRKSKESNYRHDCRVGARVFKARFDLDIVTATLAHEAKEDDDWSRERVEEEFGPYVADIMDAVSKMPKSFGSHEERLKDHIDRLHQAIGTGLWAAAVVKCADRLENTTDTAGLNEDEKKILFDETELYFIPLFQWAYYHMPIEHQMVFGLWIQDIKFSCDNYWRSLALLK